MDITIKQVEQLLPKFREQNMAKIYTMADLENHYQSDYIPKMDSRKMSLASPTIDALIGFTRPSQVVTFISPTNVGKTALLTNIAKANSDKMQDYIIPLFECEESAAGMYERFVQLENDVYTSDVEKAYKEKTADLKDFSETKFKLPNIITIIHRINIEDIVPYCLACKELSGKDIGFIGVDYLGLVKTAKLMSEYDRTTYVMTKLKEIAQSLDVPVINFAQPSRQDIKEVKELNLYSAKSSGEVENSSQIVITLQRIDENNIDKQGQGLIITDWLRELIAEEKVYLLKAKIEKKKQGKYGSVYLLFNTRSTLITEYDPNKFN
jgi:replicative DNA helicase